MPTKTTQPPTQPTQPTFTHSPGNHPFGAVLVDRASNAIWLESINTVVTQKDVTGHAELLIVRNATLNFPLEFMQGCTLYW